MRMGRKKSLTERAWNSGTWPAKEGTLLAKIAKLQAELDSLKADGIARMKKLCTDILNLKYELRKHRWIPVSEKLPESTSRVSIAFDDGIVQWQSDGSYEFGEWRTYGYKEGHITHWKPIVLPNQALQDTDGKDK